MSGRFNVIGEPKVSDDHNGITPYKAVYALCSDWNMKVIKIMG